MTKTVVFYRGLAGIGKSTKAKEEKSVNTNIWGIGPAPVVERDSFRRRGVTNEKQITYLQREEIEQKFKNGHSRVIVSDTNLNEVFFLEFIHWTREKGYETEVVDLRGQSPSEALGLMYKAIKQDVGREHAVGESVIRNQFFTHIAPLFRYSSNSDEYVIIADMDGTMADIRHRSPYATDEVILDDTPNRVLIDILASLELKWSARVLFFSGRQEKSRAYTEQWLNKHLNRYNIREWELHMREDKDNRPDYVVKEEMFDRVVREPNDAVLAVFDDRVMMRDYWNTLGLNLYSLERGKVF